MKVLAALTLYAALQGAAAVDLPQGIEFDMQPEEVVLANDGAKPSNQPNSECEYVIDRVNWDGIDFRVTLCFDKTGLYSVNYVSDAKIDSERFDEAVATIAAGKGDGETSIRQMAPRPDGTSVSIKIVEWRGENGRYSGIVHLPTGRISRSERVR